MATTNKRFVFHADPDIERWLEAESARTGCPVAELCRRAVRLAAFGEDQTAKEAGYMRARKSLEDYEAQAPHTATPVLFALKQETR